MKRGPRPAPVGPPPGYPISIDEAFLDLSGLEARFGPPAAIGRRIKVGNACPRKSLSKETTFGQDIGDLGPPDPRQPDLFEQARARPLDQGRERRLASAVDQIRTRFGADAVRRGLGTHPVDSGES